MEPPAKPDSRQTICYRKCETTHEARLKLEQEFPHLRPAHERALRGWRTRKAEHWKKRRRQYLREVGRLGRELYQEAYGDLLIELADPLDGPRPKPPKKVWEVPPTKQEAAARRRWENREARSA